LIILENLLVLFGIKTNCLSSGRSQSLYLFIRRVNKQIVVIIETYHFCQLHAKFYPTFFLLRLTPYADKLPGIISLAFDVRS
jgi:hypothetical protein